MSKIGCLGEFDVVNDDWNIYIERMKLYFAANGIKDELKFPCCLRSWGTKLIRR